MKLPDEFSDMMHDSLDSFIAEAPSDRAIDVVRTNKKLHFSLVPRKKELSQVPEDVEEAALALIETIKRYG